MRTPLAATLCLLLAIPALAQDEDAAKESERTWEYYAEVTGNFVPDGDDYVTPVFMADRDWLHLEARYNYEDQDTFSV